MPARSIRLMIRSLNRACRLQETWSGRSSNDGNGFCLNRLVLKRSNPLPARSDGLDNVDGGPDATFYIQMRIIKQVSIRSRL